MRAINCPCGTTLTGADDEVIGEAQRHAREVHDQALSREQAMSMARPA